MSDPKTQNVTMLRVRSGKNFWKFLKISIFGEKKKLPHFVTAVEGKLWLKGQTSSIHIKHDRIFFQVSPLVDLDLRQELLLNLNIVYNQTVFRQITCNSQIEIAEIECSEQTWWRLLYWIAFMVYFDKTTFSQDTPDHNTIITEDV